MIFYLRLEFVKKFYCELKLGRDCKMIKKNWFEIFFEILL